MKEKKFVVAAAQLAPVYMDREATVARACKAIAEAGSNGANLVVFPEAFIAGYPDWVWVVPNSAGSVLNPLYLALLNNAVTIPDASTARLCKAAKEAQVNVVIGLHERNAESSGASLYNSLLFIDDQGNIVGKRRKLVPTGGERTIWARGDGSTFRPFDLYGARVGGLICWENYMPLARQAMYAWGTQILASPTWDKSAGWLQSLGHIAREGGVYVIGCCSAIHMDDIPDSLGFKSYYPEGKEWVNTGNSCIVAPTGEFLAGPVAERSGLIYAEIDLDLIASSKRMFDVAGHYARPDVFQLTVNARAGKNVEVAS